MWTITHKLTQIFIRSYVSSVLFPREGKDCHEKLSAADGREDGKLWCPLRSFFWCWFSKLAHWFTDWQSSLGSVRRATVSFCYLSETSIPQPAALSPHFSFLPFLFLSLPSRPTPVLFQNASQEKTSCFCDFKPFMLRSRTIHCDSHKEVWGLAMQTCSRMKSLKIKCLGVFSLYSCQNG